MNSRERVIRAVEFEGPDRVPNGCYGLRGAFDRYGQKLEELFTRFPRDFDEDWTGVESYVPDRVFQKGTFIDVWGCVWENVQPGIMGRIIAHPLSDWKNLESYQFPDPSTVVNFDKVGEAIKLSGHAKYILGGWENFFERLHWLRGFTNTLIDLIKGSREFKILAERLFDFKIKMIKRWIELNIDGYYFFDDWGTQTRLMIRPELWREYFKPLYKKMFNVVRRAGKHVFFHSDGHILDIIPDLIEIGVDALNCQVSLIGADLLGERFGGKICILSDIDRQHILPHEDVETLREHIKYLIKILGSFNGGLISWGEIGPDVPLANAEAMLEEFDRYGRYPLRL